MSLMKAARLHEPATPFRIDEVPVPAVTGADVLVKVHASAVVPNLRNVTHVYARDKPHLPLPDLPAIFGLDPAGTVAAVGPDVTAVKPGQRVYVNPARGCGSCTKCRNGRLVECKSFTFAGYFGFGPGSKEVFRRYPYGGFAQYMLAPSYAMVPIADQISFEEACRYGYLGTSYAGLRRAGAGCDTTVLVNGATGTLGVGATLLALAMGVPKILCVARNRELLARLKALSPRRIVTHSNLDGPCTDWAIAQTDGNGPDVILDTLGTGTPASAMMEAMNSIARGGHIVVVGGMGEPLALNPLWMTTRQVSFSGSAWFTSGQAEEMARMSASGTLDMSSIEYRRFSLDQVNEAVDAARSRDLGGFTSVVVTI